MTYAVGKNDSRMRRKGRIKTDVLFRSVVMRKERILMYQNGRMAVDPQKFGKTAAVVVMSV